MDFGSSHVYAESAAENVDDDVYYSSVPKGSLNEQEKVKQNETIEQNGNGNLDPIYEAIEVKGKSKVKTDSFVYDEVPLENNNGFYSEVPVEGKALGPEVFSKPTMYKNKASLSDKLREALKKRDAQIKNGQELQTTETETEEYLEITSKEDTPPPIPSRDLINNYPSDVGTILTPVKAPPAKQLKPKMSKRAISMDNVIPALAPPPSVPRRRTLKSQSSEDQSSFSSKTSTNSLPDLEYLESVRKTIQNVYHIQPNKTVHPIHSTKQNCSPYPVVPVLSQESDLSKTNPFSVEYEAPDAAWDSIDYKPNIQQQKISKVHENDPNNNIQINASSNQLYPTLPTDSESLSLFSDDIPRQSLNPTAPSLTHTMVRKDAEFLRKQLQSLIDSERQHSDNSNPNSQRVLSDGNINTDDVTMAPTLLKPSAPHLSESMIRRDIVGRKPLLKRSNSQESVYSTADTNIVSIQLSIVKQNQSSYFCDVQPELCSTCKGVTNNMTVRWVCKFCGAANKSVGISKIPANSAKDVTYILQPAINRTFVEDFLLVFCIDTSGSMCVTSKVENQGQNTIFISRLQRVQQAISDQIRKLEVTRPYCRVALITFGNNVELLGDGSPTQYFSLGDMELFDYDYVSSIGRNIPLPGVISNTRAQLHKTIAGLKEKGGTALGPALLLSTALASQRPGSQVIVCTDGRANVGIGSLELEDDYQVCHHFYDQTSQLAAQHGVIVSIMSISGTDCRLVELGKVANKTAGKVSVVEASNISSEFQDMLTDKVLATNVKIGLVTHKQLYFSKQDGPVASEIEEFIGNITNDSEVTFRYGIKKDPEYQFKAPPKEAPFQLKIEYRGLDGSTCMRVLTQVRPVTENKELAESEMNMAVIGTYATQSAAKLALEGELGYAKEVTAAHKQLLVRGRSLRLTTGSIISTRQNEMVYESVQSQIEEIGNELSKADSSQSSSVDDLSLNDPEPIQEDEYEVVGNSSSSAPAPALPPRSYPTNSQFTNKNTATGGAPQTAKQSGIGMMTMENVLSKLPSIPKTTLKRKKNKKKKAMQYKDATAEKMFSFSKATSRHMQLAPGM